MLTFVLALIAWAVIPISDGVVLSNINVGILYLFAISSLGVYGIIVAGWASNSKYAFLGALRSAAQMVSYEVSIGFVIITVLVCVGSLNLTDIVHAQAHGWFGVWWLPGWFVFTPLLPMFVVFFISGLAETNRSPFDLVEGESELVGGYFVEYSSMVFALFYLGEYANMILISATTTILFLGGWLPLFNFAPFTWIPGPIWFAAKISFLLFGFLWVRATFPRFRYDQLMRLGWKVFLPLSLFWVVLVAGGLVAFAGCRSARYREDTQHGVSGPRCPKSAPDGAVERLEPDLPLHVQAQGDAQLPLRERPSQPRGFAASMRCAAIPTARSAALPASCARRSARRSRSRSRPSRAATAAGARRATTST